MSAGAVNTSYLMPKPGIARALPSHPVQPLPKDLQTDPIVAEGIAPSRTTHGDGEPEGRRREDRDERNSRDDPGPTTIPTISPRSPREHVNGGTTTSWTKTSGATSPTQKMDPLSGLGSRQGVRETRETNGGFSKNPLSPGFGSQVQGFVSAPDKKLGGSFLVSGSQVLEKRREDDRTGNNTLIKVMQEIKLDDDTWGSAERE